MMVRKVSKYFLHALQYDINGITNCSSILKLLSEMFLYNMKPCHLKLPSI